MSRSTPLNLSLLLLAMPLPASAATAWHCWYDLDQHVACLIRQAEPTHAQTVIAGRTQAVAAAIAPPARPRTEALPPSVRLLREQPGALRGRTILIPIYTEPFDHRRMAELAQAIMCGREPECAARYGERPAMTLADAADFVDANDPLLE